MTRNGSGAHAKIAPKEMTCYLVRRKGLISDTSYKLAGLLQSIRAVRGPGRRDYFSSLHKSKASKRGRGVLEEKQ
eukprot:6202839-Pleurochrysis_carterae.AAC.3